MVIAAVITSVEARVPGAPHTIYAQDLTAGLGEYTETIFRTACGAALGPDRPGPRMSGMGQTSAGPGGVYQN